MDKHIYCHEGALSQELCSSLIHMFNNEDNINRQELGPSNGYTRRTGDYFYEYFTLNPQEHIFWKALKTGIRKYTVLHPYLLKLSPWGMHPYCLFQKYKTGQHYSIEHCEAESPNRSMRILAWMFYLNDIDKGGGGTCFPQQEFNTIARAGDLYIWPAYWTHSHFGIPAVAEEKYIMTGWCTFLTKSHCE